MNEVKGINDITIEDINFVKQLGFRIKLISESYIVDNKIYSSTRPKLISINNPMANTNGALNAINIQTDQLDNLYLEGQGAGGIPTASSILSDIYENFNESGVSIEKILQIPDNKTDSIPIVITTHMIKSHELINSVKKISDLDFIIENITLIPIEH